MNAALQIFQTREPFYIPYSVPVNDVLVDRGPGIPAVPPATVILSAEPYTLRVRNVREATIFVVYGILYGDYVSAAYNATYRHIATFFNYYPNSPDPVELFDFNILPGYYVVFAVNLVGRSTPSPAFNFPHP